VSEKDKLHDKHEESLINQTKRYGDMLKRVIPNMPSDPADLVSWWDNCEHIRDMYDIPNRTCLLLPFLTPKAKTVVSRMKSEDMGNVDCIKNFMMREFKLTSRVYRVKLITATRNQDETHALFATRLKSMWDSYMRSCECGTYKNCRPCCCRPVKRFS